MDEFLLWIITIIEESWFLQGIIINTVFSIVSIPFTNKIVQKTFKNRKKNRIKNAYEELKIYCIQQLIEEKYIDKKRLENQMFIITKRYNLSTEDIYDDNNTFHNKLIDSIIDINLIDDSTKEKIISIIRNEKLFINSRNKNIANEYIINKNSNMILSEDNKTSSENNTNFSQEEKKSIAKYTFIITIIIFLFLVFINSLIQVLFKAYGIYSIIFINTIFIMATKIPILINGVVYYNKFNERNKKIFILFLIILLANLINFICMVSILMAK